MILPSRFPSLPRPTHNRLCRLLPPQYPHRSCRSLPQSAKQAGDDSQKQLVAVKYVNENFDTDGNASYTYFDSENGEQETQDPSYFENMFEIYEKAKIVNFKR